MIDVIPTNEYYSNLADHLVDAQVFHIRHTDGGALGGILFGLVLLVQIYGVLESRPWQKSFWESGKLWGRTNPKGNKSTAT